MTDPTPRDAVAALIEKWEQHAAYMSRPDSDGDAPTEGDYGVARGLYAAADELRALLDRPAPAVELWCLHIEGPDDVHPAPSREDAQRAADLFAAWEARQPKDEYSPVMRAIVAPWPHDAASHAAGVERFAAEWLQVPAELGISPAPAAAGDAVRLWIDCEFNEFKGELISLALVDEHGREFYEVLPCDQPGAWVAEHVMPILGKQPVDKATFQRRLADFLSQYPAIHVIADWPEDIAHFCEALITGPGYRLDTPPLTMEVVRIDAPSALPHNALADAHGIRFAMRAALAAAPAAGDDAARLDWLLSRVIVDDRGVAIPGGRTRITDDDKARSLRFLDAARKEPTP